jgi:3-deoxy-D-manno-octulosonic-acid transferase
MAFFYDLIFLCISIAYFPVYALKGKFHKGFVQRFGSIDVNLKGRPIWVHAVSVGEMKACEQLISHLRRSYPGFELAISTVTQTGNKIARSIAEEGDFVFYLPLDFSFMVKRAVNILNPALFIIAETEIWPNLISYLSVKNIPIVTVNARISDRSFKGYHMIKGLIRPILRKVSLFCVQSQGDAERLISLGVDKEKIQITGNMKYDYIGETRADYDLLRNKLALAKEDKLLVAASTHVGEEEAVLEAYKELAVQYPALKLLIAPRHPERSGQVAELIRKSGFDPDLISGLDSGSAIRNTQITQRRIFILDTIGQLAAFYGISDIVFMGGSLIKKGGHNILEPAFFGKPVLTGPHMFNFRDIINTFTRAEAVIIVQNAQELKIKIEILLKDGREAVRLGERARSILAQNQGASRRNAQCIAGILKEVKYGSGN